jgi:hypothetical protein
MHLALRFHGQQVDDCAIAAAALEQGIIAPALSVYAVGQNGHGWSGAGLCASADRTDCALAAKAGGNCAAKLCPALKCSTNLCYVSSVKRENSSWTK